MSFNDFIKSLQQKPESARLKIFWSLAALSVVLVISIWIPSFESYKSAFNQTAEDASKGMETIKAAVSEPLEQIRPEKEKEEKNEKKQSQEGNTPPRPSQEGNASEAEKEIEGDGSKVYKLPVED